MTVIVCVDDCWGMLFHCRRQSKDRAVIRDILELAAGAAIRVNTYSAALFADVAAGICPDEAFLEKAEQGDFCFVENRDILPFLEKISRVVLYRWNRRYPADRFFPVEQFQGKWELTDSREIPGFSHPCIIREVYRL